MHTGELPRAVSKIEEIRIFGSYTIGNTTIKEEFPRTEFRKYTRGGGVSPTPRNLFILHITKKCLVQKI